ncbi:MAG TPA: MFS transporter [Nevskiaceae bacterium]|nr:MFS transporter [Nevskiaceae bacterium]
MRRVLIFTIVALALMMMAVDGTIVATALDAMQHGLDTTVNWVGWTITAYALGFVLMLPISGKLSERYGRRRVFIGSVITFTVASLLCGLATDIYVLIALRALQAAGGAGFTPSATGIVVDHFGGARDRAVGLFGSIFPVGAMIGPIFGGLFVTYWTWRGVFFVNVPIGLAVIILAMRYIPHDRPTAAAARQGMDVRGMVLLGMGVLGGMLAASYLGETGTHAGSLLFVVPVVVAVVSLCGFFYHNRHTAQPFIAPRLIHGPGFGAVNLVNMVYGGATLGAIVLIPLYAAERYGLDALASGTLLVAEGIAAIVFSVAGTIALRRTGYRLPLYIGGGIIVAGILLIATPPQAGISPYVWLACATFLVGAGAGTVNPASRNAGLQLAVESSSTLAALRSMCMQIGTIVSVSIATAIMAQSANPGVVQAWYYVAIAVLLVGALPIIARIPEHHGAW